MEIVQILKKSEQNPVSVKKTKKKQLIPDT